MRVYFIPEMFEECLFFFPTFPFELFPLFSFASPFFLSHVIDVNARLPYWSANVIRQFTAGCLLPYAIDVMDDLYFFFSFLSFFLSFKKKTKRLAYYFCVNCEIILNFDVKMAMTNARDEDVPMTKVELVCARFDITGYSRVSFLVYSRRSILMFGVCAMEEPNPPERHKRRFLSSSSLFLKQGRE